MTSTTEPARAPAWTGAKPATIATGVGARRRIDARAVGWILTIAGFALLWSPSLLAGAIGLELLAAAFWWWARASDDAADQMARWQWLRRPATALWIAFAIHAAFSLPGLEHGPVFSARVVPAFVRGREWLGAFHFLEASAVVWAGLELLAALPLARAYSDFPGPFVASRPWLPALLPAAGFIVLWRQDAWLDVDVVRRTAIVLLLVTAVLAVIRAHARRSWTACLRWLVVTDCALAALVVAGGAVARTPSAMLWVGATGAHIFLLAGELRGAAPRRGRPLTRLWRAVSWVALACLTWAVVASNSAAHIGALSRIVVPGLALTAAVAAWLSVGRLLHAEERRRVARANPVLTLNHIAALTVLVLSPLALVLAWWAGFSPHPRDTTVAFAAVGLGGWAAVLARQKKARRVWGRLGVVGGLSRIVARRTFERFVRLERAAIGLFARAGRAFMGPVHDLHTGDAQEYLLFLVGVAVLAVVLPLLR